MGTSELAKKYAAVVGLPELFEVEKAIDAAVAEDRARDIRGLLYANQGSVGRREGLEAAAKVAHEHAKMWDDYRDVRGHAQTMQAEAVSIENDIRALINKNEKHEDVRDQSTLLHLLAIIHRDGGHHTQAVGLRRSVQDAKERLFNNVEKRQSAGLETAAKIHEKPSAWRTDVEAAPEEVVVSVIFEDGYRTTAHRNDSGCWFYGDDDDDPDGACCAVPTHWQLLEKIP